ncbi:MAG: metallophosphoesterase family protein [Thermoplasmata archaeon]
MKFVNSAAFYNADVLILGGDVTGKMIVPLVEQGDGSYVVDYVGEIKKVKGKEEVDALVKNIRHSGYYPYMTDRKEMDELKASKDRVDKLFTRLMGETMERWIYIAEERLKPRGTRVFITPGNDDRFIIDEVLAKSKFVVNPEDRVVNIDEHHEMVSSGWSNRTPWNSPRETSEEMLEKKIEAMTAKITNMQNCVFNLHCPPIDTPLDSAPKLDENLRAVTSGGQNVMISAGSRAVRNAIMKCQPLLGLHGHIHESKGFCTIGRTLCINPGSEYGEGVLRGALIKLSKTGMKSYVLTQG